METTVQGFIKCALLKPHSIEIEKIISIITLMTVGQSELSVIVVLFKEMLSTMAVYPKKNKTKVWNMIK